MNDPDLDGPPAVRRQRWEEEKTLVRTHERLRKHLDDDDEEMLCPRHVLPMKLMQKRRGGGKLLDSYEYVCLGVTSDGRACDQTVPVQTFPQVSATLRRSEGRGIIDT